MNSLSHAEEFDSYNLSNVMSQYNADVHNARPARDREKKDGLHSSSEA